MIRSDKIGDSLNTRSAATRYGYTILELMISLALLAVLMMVVWSMLGSYRNAETRGWDQAYRMQIIRVTRSWLEDDLAHLALPAPSVSLSDSRSNSQGRSSSSSRSANSDVFFRGDSQGFEAEILGSLDPLQWLEQITRSAEPLTTTTEAMQRSSRDDSSVIDPLTHYRLVYRIAADHRSAAGATHRLQREMTPKNRWTNRSNSSAAERVLTTEDLYRMTDETTDPQLSSQTTRTASIRNLHSPRFRYCDGSEWTDQWDSRIKGKLPVAIELSFDLFPEASALSIAGADSLDTSTVDPPWLDSSESLDSDTVLEADTPASLSADDTALERDVRIVVLIR